jgi:hypothetical protein
MNGCKKGRQHRLLPPIGALTGLLLWAVVCDANPAHAQAQAPRQGQASTPAQAQPRNEPSASYRESVRRTVEKRRLRRARRGQGMNGSQAPIGGIVPWPMPPALIIRHTADVHGEASALLGGLRR